MLCTFAVFGLSQASAQLDDDDYGFLNHVSLGVSGGTDGIGFQLATPLGYHFALRAGYSFMPAFKYSQSLTLDKTGSLGAFTTDKVELEGKLNVGNVSVLLDIYPSKKSSFRFTVGAYIGKDDIVTITNKEPFLNPAYAGMAGIDLSKKGSTVFEKYTIVTDKDGNIDGKVKVNGFKPYVGIGFGRAIPRKRVGLQFDLGVQFWGKPELQTNLMYYDGETGDFVTRYEKVEKSRITRDDKDYKDVRDALKTAEAFTVYPVMTFRLVGRLF